MGNLDAALKRYYRSISKELPCSCKAKKKIMQQIQDSVNQFFEQNPDADFKAVQTHFGEPQTIALSYIEDENAPKLLRRLHIKRRLIAIIAGTMALFLAIWMAVAVWDMIDTNDRNNGHIDDGIIVVE